MLAETDQDEFSQEKSAILKDFYIDDVLTGSDSIETVLEIRKQLSFILNDAKFDLKKWCSNNPRILKGIIILSEDLETKFPVYFGNEFIIKTLGLIWFPSEDIYRI